MATATINGVVIAESDDKDIVEGNHYFTISSVIYGVLVESDHSTHCPWKGDASYYHLEVDGQRAENAAWYYPEPYEKATHITDRIAFYPVVAVDA